MNLILILTLVQAGFKAFAQEHWGYEDPENWPGICKTGKSQSPIALSSDNSIITNMSPLFYKNYDTKFTATITNTGHSVRVNLVNANKNIPSIRGSGFNEDYLLDNVHFHWTSSEHTINEYSYHMETHLVHYASKYGNVSNASKYKDGIIVLATLSELYRGGGSKVIDEIAHTVRQIAHDIEKPVKLTNAVSIKEFLPNFSCQRYFRYEGSLTTPDCAESVVWIVFTSISTISRHQLKLLSDIYTEENKPLRRNYRPLQALNGRKVYFNMPHC